jgi:hypothetical protein
MNTEVEQIWKEAVLIKFQVLFRNSAGGPEENHKHLFHDIQFLSRDFNPRSAKYKADVWWKFVA